MRHVAILGAGFSGLSLAYHLHNLGFDISVYESASRVGGLIHTYKRFHQIYEGAASSFMASPLLHTLSQDIGIRLRPISDVALQSKRPGKNLARYIYNRDADRVMTLPRYLLRRPLGLAGLYRELRALLGLLALRRAQNGALQPQAHEDMGAWVQRCLAPRLGELLLIFLQGIFGSRIESLSATLVLEQFYAFKQLRPKPVATKSSARILYPEGGMELWTQKLSVWLKNHGIKIHLNWQERDLLTPNNPEEIVPDALVLAIPAHRLSASPYASYFADYVKIQYLSLDTVMSFAQPHPNFARDYPFSRGFGCLFPRSEALQTQESDLSQVAPRFHSLGVIFPPKHIDPCSTQSLQDPWEAHRWILSSKNYAPDEELFEQVLCDYKRLYPNHAHRQYHASIAHMERYHYAHAIPYYDTKLERLLKQELALALHQNAVPNLYFPRRTLGPKDKPCYLFSNYTGTLGLTKLLDKAYVLAMHLSRTI